MPLGTIPPQVSGVGSPEESNSASVRNEVKQTCPTGYADPRARDRAPQNTAPGKARPQTECILRPLTSGRPNPMIPIVNLPWHIVGLFERRGFAEIAVTLQFLPDEVGDYFGDSPGWGVNVSYLLEDARRGGRLREDGRAATRPGAGLLRYGEHRHLPLMPPVMREIPDPKTATSTISSRSFSPACWWRDVPSTAT